MTQEQINELRTLAQAALWTGRWYDGGCETLMGTYGDDSENAEGHGEVVHPVPLGIVPFLAAVQPAAILDIIAEIERMRVQIEAEHGLENAIERLVDLCNNDAFLCNSDEVIHAEAVLESMYKSRIAKAGQQS